MVAALVGCGGDSGAETRDERPPAAEQGNGAKPKEAKYHLHITLDGYPGPETVGILMAEERGYFADRDVNVKITCPVTPDNVVEYVSQDVVDLGISHQPQVLMAKDEDAPIIAVGSLVRRPTMAMIWLEKSGIRNLADLKGKTIAVIDFAFEEGLLRSLLARAGLTLQDVEVKQVGYRLLPALLSGRADAIFGGSGNAEGVELRALGLDPVITPVQRSGVPSYDELVVIAHRDRLARDPRPIRAFLAAVARGTAAAREDPEAAAKAVEAAREELEDFPAREGRPTEAEVKASLSLLSGASPVDPRRVGRLAAWMRGQGLIRG
jgi:putative hydroxymethylpyrimidine transport system substrate-binding protein